MHNPFTSSLTTIISFNFQIIRPGHSVRIATQTGAVNVATALPNPDPHCHLLPAVEFGLCGGQGGADRLSAAAAHYGALPAGGGPDLDRSGRAPGSLAHFLARSRRTSRTGACKQC